MTISDDFIPEESDLTPAAPTYPTAFGIKLTPAVGGVAVALLGLLGSIYLVLNLLLPTWQKYQELRASRNEKQALVTQKQAVLQQTEQIRAQLAQAKVQNSQVLSLFANERSLDTLLLDLNRVVESGNAQLPQGYPRAKLKRFVPVSQAPEIITDGSLGAEVNGKLKRQVVNVELDGTFEQTQSIIRNIERLQPLLIVRDYQSALAQAAGNQQGAVTIRRSGPNVITTSFQLQALMPASPQETATPAPK